LEIDLANQFDPANSPTIEPERIVVGDFIQWRRVDLGTDYPNDAYTATYVARITGGGSSEIQIAGTAYNSDYLFSASSSVSENFTAGFYHYQLEMVRNSDSERIVIDRGTFTAAVDLDVNGTDPRSHAEIMVDKIETVLQGRADADVLSYSINGRSLSKMPPNELVEWRDYYKREFLMEKRKERIRRKIASGATIVARF
tara:strand:- start:642 stop:1238 length:597 start_codon:yes stop_codon:yes gene_type:complete